MRRSPSRWSPACSGASTWLGTSTGCPPDSSSWSPMPSAPTAQSQQTSPGPPPSGRWGCRAGRTRGSRWRCGTSPPGTSACGIATRRQARSRCRSRTWRAPPSTSCPSSPYPTTTWTAGASAGPRRTGCYGWQSASRRPPHGPSACAPDPDRSQIQAVPSRCCQRGREFSMRKVIPSVAALAATTLILAACTDPGTGVSSPDPEGNGDGEMTADRWADPEGDLSGVELTMWAAQASADAADPVIAAFEEATGASVEVVTIPDPYEQGVQTRVATGDMPDLAFWQPTSSMLSGLNAATNPQPLDDAPWLDSYAEGLRDAAGIMDDTRYAALVTSPSVMGVYYNKTVFEEAGITELPGNFEEMVEIARDLDEQGVTPFFEMAGDRWGTQYWVQVLLADAAADGLWDRINTGEAAFTDEEVVTAIETYNGLIDEGLFNDDIATATFEDQGDALLNGDAAMAVQVNALFGQLQAKADNETLDETIGFFPISPSGNVGTSIPDQDRKSVV